MPPSGSAIGPHAHLVTRDTNLEELYPILFEEVEVLLRVFVLDERSRGETMTKGRYRAGWGRRPRVMRKSHHD